MPRRRAVTREQLEVLLALPATEAELIRHWNLGTADLAAIERRRSDPNQLGFALQLFCRAPGSASAHPRLASRAGQSAGCVADDQGRSGDEQAGLGASSRPARPVTAPLRVWYSNAPFSEQSLSIRPAPKASTPNACASLRARVPASPLSPCEPCHPCVATRPWSRRCSTRSRA
jgi:Domain of unknown function (DUF4158)